MLFQSIYYNYILKIIITIHAGCGIGMCQWTSSTWLTLPCTPCPTSHFPQLVCLLFCLSVCFYLFTRPFLFLYHSTINPIYLIAPHYNFCYDLITTFTHPTLRQMAGVSIDGQPNSDLQRHKWGQSSEEKGVQGTHGGWSVIVLLFIIIIIICFLNF